MQWEFNRINAVHISYPRVYLCPWPNNNECTVNTYNNAYFLCSQGCTIGCQECDGGSSNPNFHDRCGSGMNATVNDPLLRTYNRNVEAFSKNDVYRYEKQQQIFACGIRLPLSYLRDVDYYYYY